MNELRRSVWWERKEEERKTDVALLLHLLVTEEDEKAFPKKPPQHMHSKTCLIRLSNIALNALFGVMDCFA